MPYRLSTHISRYLHYVSLPEPVFRRIQRGGIGVINFHHCFGCDAFAAVPGDRAARELNLEYPALTACSGPP
jgi:hypothetical protein